MFALISRMLRLSGRYKKRIQLAFVCAFVEQILSKMPIFFAFLVLAGFASGTMSGARCLAVGAILVCVVVLQAVVHYASDRLQSAAGSWSIVISHWGRIRLCRSDSAGGCQ